VPLGRGDRLLLIIAVRGWGLIRFAWAFELGG
jgi:hypothetical protein